jgi:hypothetical protein
MEFNTQMFYCKKLTVKVVQFKLKTIYLLFISSAILTWVRMKHFSFLLVSIIYLVICVLRLRSFEPRNSIRFNVLEQSERNMNLKCVFGSRW